MTKLRRYKASLIIVATLLISSMSFATLAASYGAGVLEFQTKLASNGNVNAQYRLGTMYESGLGTLQDMKQAIQWYQKAAAQNHTAAINRLTYIKIRQNGFKAEHKAWLNSLQQSAGKRDGEAMLLLGQMYSNGVAVKQSSNKAIELLKMAKAKGITGAEEELDKVENRLLIARQKQRQQEAERKKQEAAARKARQEEQRRLSAQAQAREAAAERERRRQAEERRKAAEAKRRQQAAQPTASQSDTPSGDKQFESDLCKGKKARFLTACQ